MSRVPVTIGNFNVWASSMNLSFHISIEECFSGQENYSNDRRLDRQTMNVYCMEKQSKELK
jgi:hypothetical protein